MAPNRKRLTLGRLVAITYALTRVLTDDPAAPPQMREPLTPRQQKLLRLAALWAREQTRRRLEKRRQFSLEETASDE